MRRHGSIILKPRGTDVGALRFLLLSLALPLLLLLAACENNADQQQRTSDVDTMNSTIAPGSGADTSELPQHTIDVKLTEYAIEMPAQAMAGPTRVQVTNAGKEEHDLEIAGNGAVYRLSSHITPDKTQMLLVDLKPGTYDVRCPLEGHQGKGMQRQLTVTGTPPTSSP